MDSKLIELLKNHRLEDLKGSLEELGVKDCEDIMYITSDDMVHNLKLNEISKRKFYKMREEIENLSSKKQEELLNTASPLTEPVPIVPHPQAKINNTEPSNASYPEYKHDMYYTVKEEDRGVALAFITKNDRPGAEADDSNLSKLFESMGVNYVPHHDMSREDIIGIIASILSEKDIERYSMFFLVFSTHGDEDRLYDGNMDLFSIYHDILPLLKPNVCKYLEGKPKIILVQACRGDRRDSKVDLKEEECVRIDSLQPKPQIVTLETDFLIAYSCVRGYVAHRHIEEGSWFLEAFYKIYTEYGATHNFRDLLILTNRYMLSEYSLKSESGTTLQTCQYETTFMKFLKIKPTEDNRVVPKKIKLLIDNIII